MGKISIAIVGNVTERRTEAEICWQTGSNEDLVGLVFDSGDGWKTEVENKQLAESIGAEFHQAVERAQRSLSDYVNRTGENAPEGLTAAGLSLWLMVKADGTAMGYPIGKGRK